MTATAHAIVAGAIAAKFGNPTLAPLLSLASHFIMDSVPHWDFGTNWRSRPKHITGLVAFAETLIGITVAYLLFWGKAPFIPLTLSIIASLIPDWLETPWYIFFAHQNKHQPGPRASLLERATFAVYKLENSMHTKAQLPFGILTQVATVAFFVLLLR